MLKTKTQKTTTTTPKNPTPNPRNQLQLVSKSDHQPVTHFLLKKVLAMPNLIVSCTFNPPVITIIGSNLREETIHKLEQRLPTVTSTAASPKRDSAPKFVLNKDQSFWRMELGQQFCDHLGRSMIYLTIIEALEAEDWKLRATNCMVHHDTQKDTNKFFFVRA